MMCNFYIISGETDSNLESIFGSVAAGAYTKLNR